MSRFTSVLSLATGVLLLSASAVAQKSTERYIPIGKSPGLSGNHTVIGRITAVNVQQKTVTMVDSTGYTYTILVTDKTQIWSDRSSVQKTNERIALGDCRANMWCEVKYVNNERRPNGTADWIKVQVAY